MSTLGEYFREVYGNVVKKEKECLDALERSVEDMRKEITVIERT